MNHIRRSATILAGLASALLAAITTASAALASTSPGPAGPAAPGLAPVNPPRPPGWNKHPPLPGPARVHAALATGMPGWQITLIAIGAAVLAAAVAVLINQARTARRHATTSAA